MKKLLLSLITLTLSFTAVFAQGTVSVKSDITTNTTWTANNIYLLEGGFIYVRNNANLTIEPGTIIKGNGSALVITRGSKILAEGTAEKPIVFTSYKAAGSRTVGDWGGLLLLGKAPTNTVGGEGLVEGGLDATLGKYGGTDVNDNSGILKFVRIEYGGIAFQPNNETNSLTMGGVGAGTVIENVQTSFGGDDAFEWFGGTVNGKYLVTYKTVDDMFDTDFGYSGKNQFVLGVSDPKLADISGSNAFESDNDSQGTTNKPLTDATFVNVTIAGPKVFNATFDANFRRGAHIRRSSQMDLINSIVTGFPTSFRPESANSIKAYFDGSLKFDGNIFDAKKVDSTSTDFAQIKAKFEANNTFVSSGTTIFTDAAANNFLPKAGTDATKGAATGLDAYFVPTTYRGAFGTEDWTKCWCEFDPQNADYSAGLDYSFAANFTAKGSTTAPSVDFAATAPLNSTYSWNFGDGKTSTDQNPKNTYAKGGDYTVSLTVTSPRGCKKVVTQKIKVTNNVAVQEINELSAAQLFPNPTAENTTLRFDLSVPTTLTVQLTDVTGKVMSSTNNTMFNAGQNTVTIESNNVPNGLYFVNIRSKEGVKTLKLNVVR